METETILHKLGITSRYCGYSAVLQAVELARGDATRLRALEKAIYCPIADREGTAWKTVERNIRTVARTAWERNPAYLQALAGRELKRPPSAGALIKMLYWESIRQKGPGEPFLLKSK